MRSWTAICQELEYARSGRVYSSGEWIVMSDRGMVVGVMAAERGELLAALVKSMTLMKSAFEKFRDSLPTISETMAKMAGVWARAVAIETEPKDYNYAVAHGTT